MLENGIKSGGNILLGLLLESGFLTGLFFFPDVKRVARQNNRVSLLKPLYRLDAAYP